MTIYLGDATLQGNNVTITPPVGFDTIDGVRLTNYTGDVLILTDIDGRSNSQEYLMPLQQMVYHTANVQKIPRISGLALGSQFDNAALFVEWSDDSRNDFIGTYPTNITQVALVPAEFATVQLLTLDGVTPTEIPAGPRNSITLVNQGATNIAWNTVDDFAAQPSIVPGSGRSLNSGTALWFMSDAPGGLLEVFED